MDLILVKTLKYVDIYLYRWSYQWILLHLLNIPVSWADYLKEQESCVGKVNISPCLAIVVLITCSISGNVQQNGVSDANIDCTKDTVLYVLSIELYFLWLLHEVRLNWYSLLLFKVRWYWQLYREKEIKHVFFSFSKTVFRPYLHHLLRFLEPTILGTFFYRKFGGTGS